MKRRTPGDSQKIVGPGPHWMKSSLSFANGDCVEVAGLTDGLVGVRDSKDADGPVLRFTANEWRAFLGGAQNGEFDGFGKELSVTAAGW